MEQNEYELFQQVFEVFHLRSFTPKTSGSNTLLKNGVSTGLSTGVRAGQARSLAQAGGISALLAVRHEHPQLAGFFEDASVRKHFRRAFMGLLYAPFF